MANIPPIIINHSEDGQLCIGRERDKNVLRKRQVGLYGGSSAALRFFLDGGFEIRSSDDATAEQGSNILQTCPGAPLVIRSAGDIIIEADGRFSVYANDIRMESKNADEGDITLKAAHDINIDANNRAIVQSENVVLDAKCSILTHSEGWTFIVGNIVRIHEPISQLVPTTFGTAIDALVAPLKTIVSG